MQKYFTQKVDRILLELRSGQMEKAIHLIVEFIKQDNVLLDKQLVKKIDFLQTYYPFSEFTIQRIAKKKEPIFKDLSDENIKKNLEALCQTFFRLINENEVEIRLSKLINSYELRVTKYPFQCSILTDKKLITNSTLQEIDKYKVKRDIAKADLEAAFNYLISANNLGILQHFENDILTQSIRYQTMKKKWLEGLLHPTTFNIETVRISRGLLEIVDGIGKPPYAKKSGLVISDLIQKYKKGEIELDFRIFNESREGIFISRIIFKVIEIKFHYFWSYVEPTQKYGFDISSLKKKGDEAELTVAQFIKPNDVDRFTVNVFAKEISGGERRILLLNTKFQTNKGFVEGSTILLNVSA